MERIGPLFYAALIQITLAGCRPDAAYDSPSEISPSALADPLTQQARATVIYEYTAYDSNGEAVVIGALMLPAEFREGKAFRGDWHLSLTEHGNAVRAGQPGRIGPQIGKGAATGILTSGVLAVFLSSAVDNELYLEGTVDGRRITGK